MIFSSLAVKHLSNWHKIQKAFEAISDLLVIKKTIKYLIDEEQ